LKSRVFICLIAVRLAFGGQPEGPQPSPQQSYSWRAGWLFLATKRFWISFMDDSNTRNLLFEFANRLAVLTVERGRTIFAEL